VEVFDPSELTYKLVLVIVSRLGPTEITSLLLLIKSFTSERLLFVRALPNNGSGILLITRSLPSNECSFLVRFVVVTP
jgi:hypothetical protein